MIRWPRSETSRRASLVTGGTGTTCPQLGGWAVDLRQVLWSVQPYKTMPCWAQARAYSRRTSQGHLSPCAQVHRVLSHRATKGSGSTRGWQRANAEALFRSWHCSHGPCRNKMPLGEDSSRAAPALQGTGSVFLNAAP